MDKGSLPVDGLARFRELRTLQLEGQTKGIEVLGTLGQLTNLTLRSIGLPDLSLLVPLTNLKALALKLGGTTNIDLLPAIGDLRYLELWMVKGMSDIQAISGLSSLNFLFLQGLKNVTSLPCFTSENVVRGVHLETMKGLKDLSPLAGTPHLEQLAIFDMPLLTPTDLDFLVGHPSLREITPSPGGKRKYEAITAKFGLPRVSSNKADWIAEATRR